MPTLPTARPRRLASGIPAPMPGYAPRATPGAVTTAPAPGAPRPYTPPVTPTTFEPPRPPSDPRIADLMSALDQQTKQGQPYGLTSEIADTRRRITEADTRGETELRALSTQQDPKLQALISALMSGQGPSVGPIETDPEAAAYRLAKGRAGQQQRATAAARSAAGGGGNLDAAVNQIAEAGGEDVAQFEGALAGRRKHDALETALAGANLSIADVGRRADLVRSSHDVGSQNLTRLLDSLLAQEAQDRTSAQVRTGNQQHLLGTMLGERGRTESLATDTAFRTAEENRAENDYRRRIEEETRRRAPRGGVAAAGRF